MLIWHIHSTSPPLFLSFSVLPVPIQNSAMLMMYYGFLSNIGLNKLVPLNMKDMGYVTQCRDMSRFVTNDCHRALIYEKYYNNPT